MRWAVLLTALSAWGAGCTKERPGGSATNDAGNLPSVIAPPAQAVTIPKLDAQMLDRFISYQRTLISLYPKMVKALDELAVKLDAGVDSSAAMAASVQAMKGQAEAQQKAREASGLGQDEINGIERMVVDLVVRRSEARQMNMEATIRQLEEMAARARPEQKAQFQLAVQQAKRQADEQKNLTELRKRYGDSNVDLLLTRGDELEKNLNAISAAFFGTARDLERRR